MAKIIVVEDDLVLAEVAFEGPRKVFALAVVCFRAIVGRVRQHGAVQEPRGHPGPEHQNQGAHPFGCPPVGFEQHLTAHRVADEHRLLAAGRDDRPASLGNDGRSDLGVGGAFEPDAILAGTQPFAFAGTLTRASGTGIALGVDGFVLAGLVLASLGKCIFDPAVQAYAGAHVPFERRGLAIGMGELAWSLSSFLGIPLIGIAIDRYGWRSPFFLLAALSSVGLPGLNGFVGEFVILLGTFKVNWVAAAFGLTKVRNSCKHC